MNKRVLTAIAVAGIVGGGTYGFAATLGVTSDDLGAGSTDVLACDADGVTVDYTAAWNGATAGSYEVATITVNGIDATECAGDVVQVTVVDADGAQLGNATNTAVIDAASEAFDVASQDISAALVEDVHVVIAG